jgi:hypothetical protein
MNTVRAGLMELDVDKVHRDRARTLLEEQDALMGKELGKFARVLDRADKDRHKKRIEYLRGMLSAVAIAKNDWNSQRAELDKIKDEIRSRNQEATYWEKRDIEKITASIKDAERTIAEVVAMWKVYSHTLPAGTTIPDELQRPFASLYGQYMGWMDLGEYKTAYMQVAKGYQDKLQSYYK